MKKQMGTYEKKKGLSYLSLFEQRSFCYHNIVKEGDIIWNSWHKNGLRKKRSIDLNGFTIKNFVFLLKKANLTYSLITADRKGIVYLQSNKM